MWYEYESVTNVAADVAIAVQRAAGNPTGWHRPDGDLTDRVVDEVDPASYAVDDAVLRAARAGGAW